MSPKSCIINSIKLLKVNNMPKINSIEKMTDNKYLNMYRYKVESEKGHKGDYFVASRA